MNRNLSKIYCSRGSDPINTFPIDKIYICRHLYCVRILNSQLLVLYLSISINSFINQFLKNEFFECLSVALSVRSG